jgi:hypothetical protein
MVRRLLSPFGTQRVFYHQQWGSSSTPLVTLVSGSLSYINSLVFTTAMSTTNKAIGIIDHHFYGCLRNWRPSGLPVGHGRESCRWTRTRHESVGGASSFVSLFCLIEPHNPVATILQWTLRHILDHGIRPTCIRDTDTQCEPALTLKDSIHPVALDRSIIYSTQFCCTGWGIHVLTPGELGQVFGLPMLCRLGDLNIGDFASLIPAHLFQAILEEFHPSSSQAATN